jgi:hypothetical protein
VRAMNCGPVEGTSLESKRTLVSDAISEPFWGRGSAVCQQAVITHSHPDISAKIHTTTPPCSVDHGYLFSVLL